MRKFNEVVIEKMKELNITRYRLHKITGISQPTLLRIERNQDGTFEFSNVLKIAKVLNIDLNIFKEL